MRFAVFILISIIMLLIIFIMNKPKIKYFLSQPNNIYYLCWIAMLLSNLAFPKTIQYATRTFGIIFTWVIILLTSKVKKNKLNLNFLTLFLLINILFYFFSTIYSISKFETFIKCIEIFTDFWLIYVIVKNDENFVVNTLNVTMQTMIICVLITVIGFFVIPSYFTEAGYTILHSSLGTRLSAGFLGANKTSAISVLYIMWLFFSNRKIEIYEILMFLVCCIAMFYSQSRSTLILIPIILVFRFFKPKSKYKLLYFMIIVSIVLIGFKNFDKIENYILRGQSETVLKSGTGRTEMWNLATVYIKEKPILGYGYGVGGEIVAEKMFNVTSMHSAIYETLLGTGYVGLFMLCLQFFIVFIEIIKRMLKFGFKNSIFDVLLISFFLIRSLTSTGIASWHSMELMIWYLIIFSITIKRETIQMILNDKNVNFNISN